MPKRKTKAIISVLLCFSLIFAYSSSLNSNSFFNGESETQSTKQTAQVKAPFVIALIFDEASLFSGIIGFSWVYSKVTVKGYSGNFTEIALNNSEETGYILSFCLSDTSSQLVVKYANIFTDQTRNILKDYNNPQDFSWSVSEDGIISINKSTGKVTPIKSGTVVVTAKYGGKSNKCVVSIINRWKNQEKAKAEKDVCLKSSPASSSYTVYDVITASKGTELIAVGDTAQANGQVYVKIKNGDSYKYGHISLSDFPGIDYIMTQYHYYDKGYNIRFGSASDKIYDYASVLDDVMMKNFNLKVCPYVYSYTSLADNCKIASYGSVKSDNLAKGCPKTGEHNSKSCLTTKNLRINLENQKGNGGGVVSKVLWTGHIMSDHKDDRSNATIGMGTVIITPYSRVDNEDYTNLSSSTVRKESIFSIAHESMHQLGLSDHYCYNDQGGVDGEKCSNEGGCYLCYGDGNEPDCIMMYRKYPTETSNLLCGKCKSQVKKNLSNNF